MKNRIINNISDETCFCTSLFILKYKEESEENDMAEVFNVNNFVIDHVIRGMMFSSHDDSLMWSINQITDPSLAITAENTQAVDALGTPIATFDRSKSAEFSGSNSLFDLGLYAAQNGRDKEIAGDNVTTIEVPAFEEFSISATNTTYTVRHTPVVAPTFVYALNGDGTTGKKFSSDSEASADSKFTYNNGTITLPNDVFGDFLVVYDYESENAVAVIGDAVNFPKAGRFVMEVLGTDVCDQTNLIHAYVEFPNAKLDPNVDVSFTTDTTHPFTIIAQQQYCDKDKILFRIIVPDEE